MQLWGTSRNSNIEILQRYQSMMLRTITGAPWYMTNHDIHKDMELPLVKDEIKSNAERYISKLHNHDNVLALGLLDNKSNRRRLKDFMYWTCHIDTQIDKNM